MYVYSVREHVQYRKGLLQQLFTHPYGGIHTRQGDREVFKELMRAREKSSFLCLYSTQTPFKDILNSTCVSYFIADWQNAEPILSSAKGVWYGSEVNTGNKYRNSSRSLWRTAGWSMGIFHYRNSSSMVEANQQAVTAWNTFKIRKL